MSSKILFLGYFMYIYLVYTWFIKLGNFKIEIKTDNDFFWMLFICF